MDTAMAKQPPPAGGQIFNVVFIGAGGINFGSQEGMSWNHSVRLEDKVRPHSGALIAYRSWGLGCVLLR